MSTTKRSIRSMLRDESGNVAMTFGLMMFPILGLMGAAVDYSQAVRIQYRLQAAADAAALTAMNSRGLSDTERQSIAQATFKANFKPEAPASVSDAVINVQADSVTVNATQSVATNVMTLFGIDSIQVNSSSAASVSTTGSKAEVAMMIDLTGSMGSTRNGSTKIASLKIAADDVLDILFPNNATSSNNVRVAVAPVADYVNAGPYAATATGLPSTGYYNNQYNLASTRHGPFSGSYTGSYTGSSAGSQAGSTSASSSTAGSTYDNQYCAEPTSTTTTTTNVTYTGRINHNNYTWNVAASYSYYWYSGASWGYFWVENYYGIPGNWAYGRMYYTPRTTTTSTTSTVPGCEGQNTNNGQLISCVTERTDVNHRYDDESPTTGGFVGPYNQSASGAINKLNYSDDGKCYTAGRELPEVIPLTNDRSTLDTFFNNATIGGGTPGHLGHAWAWYMLSPNWSSVWPSASEPVAYSNTGTKKYAIIMTDGEYNQQYSSVSSRTQALALCTGMKAQGIKVFTIGFGYNTSTQIGASNAEGQAKELLSQCASDSSSYFFPYDGDALRTAFQAIGNSIMGDGVATSNVKLTQ